MADPVTDFDRDIWFASYFRGREDAKAKTKAVLLLPKQAADWSWKQIAAYRDGYQMGYTRYMQEGGSNFLWNWEKIKWE